MKLLVFLCALLSLTSLYAQDDVTHEIESNSDKTFLTRSYWSEDIYIPTINYHGQARAHLGLVCLERVEKKCEEMRLFQAFEISDKKGSVYYEYLDDELLAQEALALSHFLRNEKFKYYDLTAEGFIRLYLSAPISETYLVLLLYPLLPATFAVDLLTIPFQPIIKGPIKLIRVSKLRRMGKRIEKFVKKGRTFKRGILSKDDHIIKRRY